MESQQDSESPVIEGTPGAQRRRKSRSKRQKTQKAIGRGGAIAKWGYYRTAGANHKRIKNL